MQWLHATKACRIIKNTSRCSCGPSQLSAVRQTYSHRWGGLGGGYVIIRLYENVCRYFEVVTEPNAKPAWNLDGVKTYNTTNTKAKAQN